MSRQIHNPIACLTLRRVWLITLVALAPCGTLHAQTWTAGNGINWNDNLNWSGGIPTASSNVVFNAGAPFSPFLSANGFAATLTFNSGSTNYDLTSGAGVSLSGVTAITVAAGTTGVTTINLANIATGSLLFPSFQNLTFTNNAAFTGFAAPTLVIGPNTVIGTPGTGGVVFGGTGTTTVSGSFSTTGPPNNQVQGGLTKNGTGTLVLSGNGSNLIGGVNFGGGTLRLDYSTNTASKFNGLLTSSGGDIAIVPNAAVAIVQSMTGLSLAGGHTQVNDAGSGDSVTLNLGTLSRSATATIDFSGSPSSSLQSVTGNTNGLVGTGPAFATIGGLRWATSTGTFIQSLTGTANTFSAGTNTEITGSQSAGPHTTNSLRFNFNTQSVILNAAASLTIQSGGILVPAGVTGSEISGFSNSILTTPGGTGEFLVHAYGPLTITAPLVSSGGLTKTGPADLVLVGNNTGLSGPINIHRGGLRLTNSFASGGASAINFTDLNTRGNNSQTLTVQTGNDTNPTITQPIRFSASASGPDVFPNVLSTGTSTNSRVTLSGVLSSAPGITTPIRITDQSNQTSGFNLTGVNTFTGTVRVQNGTLGINSNASLGDPANRLVLNNGSASTGGLEFLNGGINLARPVETLSSSRIVSNGTDVNTLSGPLSGGSIVDALVKAGTGTLALTGANSMPGIIDIRQGTLGVNAAGLGTASRFIVQPGATLAVSQDATYGASRNFFLGSFGAIGLATLDVAGGATFTIDGQFQPNSTAIMGLVKTGPGTLVLNNATNNYANGTIVRAGVLRAGSDGALSSGPVVVEPAGRLTYANSTTTARTFNLTGGTLEAGTGATVTLNGATVLGGFMRSAGTGQFAVGAAGATLFGTTVFNGTTINQTGGPLTAENLTFGGSQTVATGQTFTGNGLNYTASSQLTVAGTANVTNFTSVGRTTINSGGSLVQQNANAAAPLTLGGGSVTTVNAGGTLNLGGSGATQLGRLAGGVLINSGNVTGGRLVVDFGGLARGTGSYSVNPLTVNGGQFSPGSSPGRVNVEAFIADAGGSYLFEINDGTPGFQGPIGSSNLRGWDMTTVRDNTTPANSAFFMESTPTNRFTINLRTLTAPSPPDVNGNMDNFNPNAPTQWLAFSVDPAATNPFPNGFDPNAFAVNTSGFSNPTGGSFNVARVGNDVFVTYAPVPEPGLVLAAAAGALGLFARRRARHAV